MNCEEKRLAHNKYMKEWRKKNLIVARAIDKRYYRKHKKRILKIKLKRLREAYKRNPEKFKALSRLYREKHPEKVKETNQIASKKWRRKNRNHFNMRYATDSKYRMTVILRGRVWKALKGGMKTKRTKDLLGCSIEYFLKYIKSKFKDGMSWENQGKWHIDHIRPCVLFDLTKNEDQKRCFHYSNLQPLWRRDNLKKGIRHG